VGTTDAAVTSGAAAGVAAGVAADLAAAGVAVGTSVAEVTPLGVMTTAAPANQQPAFELPCHDLAYCTGFWCRHRLELFAGLAAASGALEAGLARVMLPGAMTMALQRTLSQHPRKYF